MTEECIKLNIGSGETEIPGFTNIDRIHGQEAYPLEYDDGSVDEIRASHILEHFGWKECEDVVLDWARVLKPQGVMRLAVPDFRFISQRFAACNGNADEANLLRAYAMGGQTDDNDFHKSAWDESSLTALMERAGISDIRRWSSEIEDCAALPVSLNLQGVKAKEVCRTMESPKIIGVMSTAKLGFTENMFCAMQAFAPRGINIIKNTGAFWGQCMERTMQLAIEQGAEWIVTLDYDTAFTPEQFDRLCWDLYSHPEIDALAPWQVKRESDTPLIWLRGEDGQPRLEVPLAEFNEDVTQVCDAHFGLTLFRVESLKKMPHPWFLAEPNDDGEWGENRKDEDIYFWRKWNDIGNTIYIANRVTIGHCQQMVSWIGHNYKPVHQYVADFQKEGPPPGILK